MISDRIIRVLFGAEGDLVRERRAQGVFAGHASLIMATGLVSPLISDLATVFSVSEARAGLFIIIYTGTLMVTIPFAGIVADRVGEKQTVIPGLVVFGVAGGLIAFVNTFEVALGLRVLQGVGVAFTQPVFVAMLGSMFTGAREATAQGIRVAFDSVVSAAAPVVAGVMFVVAWQFPFLVYFLAVPLAIGLWFVVPDLDNTTSRSPKRYLSDLFSVLREPVIGLLMVSFFFRHTLLYGMYTYVSVLATREAGMAVVLVGVLLGSRAVLKTISSMQAGRFAGIYSPVSVAVIGFVMVGGGIFLMGLFPTVGVLFFGIMLLGLGDGLLSPTQKSLVNQLAPPEFRNSVMSAGFTFVNIGKTGGPILVGIGLGIIGPALSFMLLGAIGGGMGSALLAAIWYLDD